MMFGPKHIPAAQYPSEKCRWCTKRIGIDGPFPVPVCTPCFNRAYASPGAFYECGPCFSKAFASQRVHGRCQHAPANYQPFLWKRLCTEFESEVRVWAKMAKDRPTLTDSIIAGNEAAAEVHEMQSQVFKFIAQGKSDEAKALNLEVERRMGEILRFRKSAPVHFAQLEESFKKEEGSGHD